MAMTLEKALELIDEIVSEHSDEYTEYLERLVEIKNHDIPSEPFEKALQREIISQGRYIRDNTEIVETTITPKKPEPIVTKTREWKF